MEETITSLQQKVETALAEDSRTKDYGVEVVDSNGVITLRGRVPSRQAGETVENVTRKVTGVKSVINHLDVK